MNLSSFKEEHISQDTSTAKDEEAWFSVLDKRRSIGSPNQPIFKCVVGTHS